MYSYPCPFVFRKGSHTLLSVRPQSRLLIQGWTIICNVSNVFLFHRFHSISLTGSPPSSPYDLHPKHVQQLHCSCHNSSLLSYVLLFSSSDTCETTSIIILMKLSIEDTWKKHYDVNYSLEVMTPQGK